MRAYRVQAKAKGSGGPNAKRKGLERTGGKAMSWEGESTGGVPDLHGDQPVADVHLFWKEVGADRRLVLIAEALVHVLVHQRRFTHSAHTYIHTSISKLTDMLVHMHIHTFLNSCMNLYTVFRSVQSRSEKDSSYWPFYVSKSKIVFIKKTYASQFKLVLLS